MRRKSTRASRRSPGRLCSLSRLGSELSAAINRVRQTFGTIPMAPLASHPSIRQAEEKVDRAAQRLQRGECDQTTWRHSLCEYERAWLVLLAETHGGGGLMPLIGPRFRRPRLSRRDRCAA